MKLQATATEINLNRPTYQMKYYSDWRIDSTDTDFDIDNYFTFDTPSGNGTLSFFVFNVAINEQENLDAQIKVHLEKVIKNGTVTKFDTWGKYKGHGAKITGKILGTFKGEVKIFVHSDDKYSFLIAYQIYDSDKQKDLPGLKLIESTFKTK